MKFTPKSLLLLFVALVAVFLFSSCEKTPITPSEDATVGTEITEINEDFEPTAPRTYTDEEVNQLVESFSGRSSEEMTVKEKMMIMGDIRAAEFESSSATHRDDSYLCFAITKIKPQGQPASWRDDGAFSPCLPTTTLRARADQKQENPPFIEQLYALSYVRENGIIIDNKFDFQVNYTCADELRLRSTAYVFSSGSTYTIAYEVCQD